MITLTIQEAMESGEKTKGHCIYFYLDNDTLLYIGRSIRPCERLREHLGETPLYPFPDSVGSIIMDNMPESLLWIVKIWTIEELRPDIYQEALRTGMIDRLVKDLEEASIMRYKPHLNGIGHNYHNPLPDRYIKRKIANEGVKLGKRG